MRGGVFRHIFYHSSCWLGAGRAANFASWWRQVSYEAKAEALKKLSWSTRLFSAAANFAEKSGQKSAQRHITWACSPDIDVVPINNEEKIQLSFTFLVFTNDGPFSIAVQTAEVPACKRVMCWGSHFLHRTADFESAAMYIMVVSGNWEIFERSRIDIDFSSKCELPPLPE